MKNLIGNTKNLTTNLEKNKSNTRTKNSFHNFHLTTLTNLTIHTDKTSNKRLTCTNTNGYRLVTGAGSVYKRGKSQTWFTTRYSINLVLLRDLRTSYLITLWTPSSKPDQLGYCLKTKSIARWQLKYWRIRMGLILVKADLRIS